MRIISPRIFAALVGLGVLCVFVPNARSDDATDWANQQAQAQKDREAWENQQAQAQRDREQAERDQQERFLRPLLLRRLRENCAAVRA